MYFRIFYVLHALFVGNCAFLKIFPKFFVMTERNMRSTDSLAAPEHCVFAAHPTLKLI